MIDLFAIDFVMASTEQLLALTRVAKALRTRCKHLRTVWHGGSVPTRTLLEGAMIYLCNNILCRYGASETGVIAQATAHEILAKPGLVGRIVPGMEVGIFDQAGHRCASGKFGLIRVRPNVVTQHPEEDERWIDLGDTGWIDSDHQLYVVGRSSDAAEVDAKISPVYEVEHLLRLEWDLNDAAAVLVDAAAGEMPQIWIGIVDNESVTSEKLAGMLRPRGIGHTIRVFSLRGIPRGANGKVNRQQLKALMLVSEAPPVASHGASCS